MSQSKIYAGNLAYQTTEEGLREAFSGYGNITDLKLITDRDTGRSKGFGFITFEEASAAEAALEKNGTDLDGRQIRVSLAKEDDRGGSRGGRGGRFGGGNGGNRRF